MSQEKDTDISLYKAFWDGVWRGAYYGTVLSLSAIAIIFSVNALWTK